MKRAAWAAMLGLLVLAAAPRAAESVASEPVETSHDASPAQPADTSEAMPPGAQGMRAHIDPVTGELVDEPATPEQRDHAAGLAIPAPDYSKLRYERRPDGSFTVHANGQFQSTSTIQTEADGSMRVGCTQSGAHADHQHEPLDAGAQP